MACALPIGGRQYFTCPSCRAEHERKLSVLRVADGVVYRCFRASCGLGGGFIPTTPSLGYGVEKIFVPKPFYEATEALPTPIVEWLITKYGVTREEISTNGLLYAPESNRLVIPIRDWRGYDLGIQAKRLPNIRGGDPVYSGQKACNYYVHEGPYLCFPVGPLRTTDTMVFVEDPLSAIRVARFANACALLGHSLNENMIPELKRWWRGDRAILALDPDAYTQALKAKEKYCLYFGTLEVRKLSNDPKDIPHAQLVEELAI
jgi:hypothetical protein